jgi:two-component system chemotaxis sensor kinase CheA
VDEIFGEGQAVVKPLPAKFQGVVGISGATITGGGRVALILDVAGLMRRVEEDKTAP